MVKRGIEHSTKHVIIDVIRKNPSIRFTDINKKVGISKPALSQHLKELQENNMVKSNKVGREKFYNLTKSIFKKKNLQMLKSMGQYRDMFAITVGLEQESVESSIKDIEKTISALFFYCMLKGLNTGENWFTNFRLDDFVISTLSFFFELITNGFIPDKLIKKLTNEDIEGIFKTFPKLNLEDKDIERFTRLELIIRNLYGDKFKMIDND